MHGEGGGGTYTACGREMLSLGEVISALISPPPPADRHHHSPSRRRDPQTVTSLFDVNGEVMNPLNYQARTDEP